LYFTELSHPFNQITLIITLVTMWVLNKCRDKTIIITNNQQRLFTRKRPN